MVSGAATKTYTYGLRRISENQLSGSTWTPIFYGYDGHGNVRFTTSTAGTVGNTYQFDAFGMPIASAGTTANTYLYSGERFDSALNLYHLRARYYNMLTGRFMTMEHRSCCKARSCSLRWSNSFAYADDDPVDRIDPTGRDAIAEYVVDLRPLVIAATGVYLLAKAIETFDEECELFAYEFDGSRTKCHYNCPKFGHLCSYVDGSCPDPELSIFLSECD